MECHFINKEALEYLEDNNFEGFYEARLLAIKEKIEERTKI